MSNSNVTVSAHAAKNHPGRPADRDLDIANVFTDLESIGCDGDILRNCLADIHAQLEWVGSIAGDGVDVALGNALFHIRARIQGALAAHDDIVRRSRETQPPAPTEPPPTGPAISGIDESFVADLRYSVDTMMSAARVVFLEMSTKTETFDADSHAFNDAYAGAVDAISSLRATR